MITKVTVTADRLLTEAERPAYVNHVHLVVTVRVNPVSLTIGNTAFLT